MSVSPDSAAHLPRHRRPAEYDGTGRDPVWFIEADQPGPSLQYRPDPDAPGTHGFVEPNGSMTFEAYRAAVEATRENWHLQGRQGD
jgi:hypothetical protein